MSKGILIDKKSGKPIMVGHYIFGTAKREDGSLVKFNSVQLIEIITGLFGVLYKEEMFTVMPYKESPQIIKAFRHTGKVKYDD